MKHALAKSAVVLIVMVAVLSFSLGVSAILFLNSGNNGSGSYSIHDGFTFNEGFRSNGQNAAVAQPFSVDLVTITVSHDGLTSYNATYHNLVTNAGEDVISRQTACGATGAPACANGGIYIALTADSTAPSATDTTCASEQTTNGLSRALGTYTHTTGTNTHKISNTFTYTASSTVTINKVCMFDASSSGNLFAETLLSAGASVAANGDQITINWTFTH
jgi:hypothetical protein